MRLKSLSVKNFRCITDTHIHLDPLTSFVGPNNSGKSTILKAIAILLDMKSTLVQSDISAAYVGQEILLQADFGDLTSDELEVLSNHIHNQMISIRVTATIEQDGSIGETSRTIAAPYWLEHWFLNQEADGRLSNAEKVANELSQARDLMLLEFLTGNPKKGRTKPEILDFQSQWLQSNAVIEEIPQLKWLPLPKSGPFAEVLPEVQLLPAELTIDDDASLKSGSLFHRLIKMMMTSMDAEFEAVQSVFNQAIKTMAEGNASVIREKFEQAISDELGEWGTTASINIKPPDARSILEKSFDLKLDDGIASAADKKGHGLQRATFFALTRALAKIQQEAGSVISQHRSLCLLVEEPELYLHPQAQRRLRTSLEQLSGSENTQVLLATHSTQFINFAQSHEIRRMTRGPEGTRRVHSIDMEKLQSIFGDKQHHNMDYWLNPHRNEVFFSDCVLLVEGQTESTIIPTLCQLLGEDITTLSALDAGGKGNLPYFIKVLNEFNIPYLVVHDEDPLSKPESEYQNDKRLHEDRTTFELNKRIAESIKSGLGIQFIVCPEFEPMFGVSKKSANKLGKSLAAHRRLELYLAEETLSLPKTIHDILAALREVKRLANTNVLPERANSA